MMIKLVEGRVFQDLIKSHKNLKTKNLMNLIFYEFIKR